MKNDKLRFYHQMIMMETLLSPNTISKTAQEGMASSVTSFIYDYFKSKLQGFESSDDKISQIVGFLTPGILKTLGFGKLALIFTMAESFFGFDLSKILKEIGSKVKELVTGSSPPSTDQIHSIVSAAVDSAKSDMSPTAIYEKVKQYVTDAVHTDSDTNKVSEATLRDAQFFRISMDHYESLNKTAGVAEVVARFMVGRNKSTRILTMVLVWIVTALFSAAGFMVLGDVVNHFVGKERPGVGGPAKDNENTTVSYAPQPVQSKQTVFKPNPNYQAEFYNQNGNSWMLPGNESSVEPTLLAWTKEIYPDLQGQDSLIKSSQAFNHVVNAIKAYNAGDNSNLLYIPKAWSSRKQIVDQFIDEIAQKSGQSSQPNKDSNESLVNKSVPVVYK